MRLYVAAFRLFESEGFNVYGYTQRLEERDDGSMPACEPRFKIYTSLQKNTLAQAYAAAFADFFEPYSLLWQKCQTAQEPLTLLLEHDSEAVKQVAAQNFAKAGAAFHIGSLAEYGERYHFLRNFFFYIYSWANFEAGKKISVSPLEKKFLAGKSPADDPQKAERELVQRREKRLAHFAALREAINKNGFDLEKAFGKKI